MTDSQIRVEGGADAEPAAPPPPDAPNLSPVLTGVAGIAIGVMVAVALSGSGSDEGPQPDVTADAATVSDPANIPTTTVTTLPPPSDPTLQDLVPGLSDSLIGFGFAADGAATVDRWDASEHEARSTTLPWGLVTADVSRSWIAVSSDQRYTAEQTLWIGNSSYVEPVAVSTQSYVWSSAIPGQLGFIERVALGGGGELRLRTRVFSFDGTQGPSLDVVVPTGSQLVWYGPTQLTAIVPVEDSDQVQLMRIGLDGNSRDTIVVDEFIAGSDTFALVTIDGVRQLINSEHEIIGPFPSSTRGCGVGSFSPAVNLLRRKLAMSCDLPDGTRGIKVWNFGVGDPLAVTDGGFQEVLDLDTFSWDAAGRFVISSTPVNTGRPESIVTIFDTDATESYRLRWPGSIVQIETVSR